MVAADSISPSSMSISNMTAETAIPRGDTLRQQGEFSELRRRLASDELHVYLRPDQEESEEPSDKLRVSATTHRRKVMREQLK